MGNDRKVVVILAAALASFLVLAALAVLLVWFLRGGSLLDTGDAVAAQIEKDISLADSLLSQRQYSEAIGVLNEAQAKLNLSLLARKSSGLSEKISQRLSSASEEKADYESKVAQGYTNFEGHFLSPAERRRILRQREVNGQQAVEKETQRAEQQRTEEAEKLRAKAQEAADRAYKESAEALAEDILRLVSAAESGISREEYAERLQTLKLQCDRFVLRCSGTEAKKPSCASLKLAVSVLGAAAEVRNGSPDVRRGSENPMRDSCEKARYHHRRVLAFLAEGR
jgi:hypothetical protein